MPATADGPRMDEALYRAYLATHFHIHVEPPIVLRIGHDAPQFAQWFQAQGHRAAMLLTAWNPFSVPMAKPENERRQRALIAEVDTLGYRHVDAVGKDPAGEWEEASLCVFDVPPEQRDAWMRRYEQNAVVLIDAEGKVRLYWHPDLHSYDEQ